MYKGTTFGDPHVTTFDGLTYDYNGIGEYWLIKSDALHVQVRTLRAKDPFGNPVRASIFGGYAIEVPQGPTQSGSDRIHLHIAYANGLIFIIV